MKYKNTRSEHLKKYKISNQHLTDWFNYANTHSFNNSSAKKDIIYGVEKLILYIEEHKSKEFI